ncbi:hypothetical protein BC830DRAFT_1143248 [Chytriomyces sp. MP71]|nr:hypothetical protein BC830DRAFT_1143248 [Chytriomyces sp. MP71]
MNSLGRLFKSQNKIVGSSSSLSLDTKSRQDSTKAGGSKQDTPRQESGKLENGRFDGGRQDSASSPLSPVTSPSYLANIAVKREKSIHSLHSNASLNSGGGSDKILASDAASIKSEAVSIRSEAVSIKSRAASVKSSHSNLSMATSQTDKTNNHQLKEVFKKLVTYDRIIKITAPSVEGPGPWSDAPETSPVPQRKLNIVENDHRPVHVMTIGRPHLNPTTNEEERRIKLYEHTIHIQNIKEVVEKLHTVPEEALIHVDQILKYPQSKSKLTDKIMTKSAAIRSLSMAQISLLPLFGNWLNPVLCPEKEVNACSQTIFLCGHCPDHVRHLFRI